MTQLCQIRLDYLPLDTKHFQPQVAVIQSHTKDSLILPSINTEDSFQNLISAPGNTLNLFTGCKLHAESHLPDPKDIMQFNCLKIFHWLETESKKRYRDPKTTNKSRSPKNVSIKNVYWIHVLDRIYQWLQGKQKIILQMSLQLMQLCAQEKSLAQHPYFAFCFISFTTNFNHLWNRLFLPV